MLHACPNAEPKLHNPALLIQILSAQAGYFLRTLLAKRIIVQGKCNVLSHRINEKFMSAREC